MTGQTPAPTVSATAPVEATAAAAEVTATSQAPAATQEAPKEKDQFAEKLELLSRRERSIVRERMRVEQEKKQLEADRAEYERFKTLKSTAKKNPLDFLNEAGLSYDEITQYMLNGGKPTEKNELEEIRQQFQQLREEREKEKQDQQTQALEAQRQAEAKVVEEFKGEIEKFIQENASTYELSSKRDSTEDVWNTISDAYRINLQAWHDGGRIGRPPSHMGIKEAADIVEEFYEKEVLRLAESAKIRAKFAQQKEPVAPGREAPKTLTNAMSSAAPSMLPASTEADRMKRALAKLG